VKDPGPRAPFSRPDRVVVSVIDGLGLEEARGMDAVAWFAARGRCFETAVGSPTISRAVYTVLSSGVEQDRSGVRSNDHRGAAPVRSVWEDARRAGWHVRVTSQIVWWTELFPGGFDEHLVPGPDVPAPGPPRTMDLVHLLYVDDAGHLAGAASPDYAAAVRRADRAITGLANEADLANTLLVLTADHGHSLRGGHGGLQPRLANVMTCFAGKNVGHDPAVGKLRMTALAPAIALLSGLPFPRDMRAGAGEDELDTVLSLVEPGGANAGYVADRRGEVERFRARARAELRGTWADLYARGHARQHWVGIAVLVGLALALFGRRDGRRAAWALGTIAVMAVGVAVARGSFDLTGVNQRASYVANVGLICFAIAAVGAAVFARLRRGDVEEALRLLATIVLALLGLTLGHIIVYGFWVGFPLPSPPLLFLPLFTTVAAGATAVLGLCLCAAVAVRRRLG
jgi:hypothetical protein